MSILKSTGLGADKARMDILYGRREEFYNEINFWNSDKKVKYIHQKSTRLSSSIF